MADVILTGDVKTVSGTGVTTPAVTVNSTVEQGSVMQGKLSTGGGVPGPAGPAGSTNHLLLTNIGTNTHAQIDTAVSASTSHIANTSNPHSVTKTQVGLGNVDNTSDVNKPVSTAQQTALDLKVDENASITGATKTKVTYDAKGLVTAGADATTADIADSSNKRYVTDADLTDIGNLSGVNTGDQTVPVKATGAETDTGTDDAKFLTPKAIEDSSYAKTAYADALVVDSIADSDTTHAPSRNAVFDALALKQPLDSDLTTIAGLTATTDNFMVATADAWASRTPTQARTQLGLGTLATQSGTFSGTSSGTNTGDQTISDATISTTDITTNDATTSKHGFLQKLPGGTTTFLRGDGSFATPGGAGDVSSNTATSVVNEVALFTDTTGKSIKRATGSGIATLTSGVLSATATTGSGSVVLGTSPTITTPVVDQFSSASGVGAAWASWTPTLTNITLGSGTLTSTYIQIGKTVFAKFMFTYGVGSAVGTGPTFTLPVAPNTTGLTSLGFPLGTALIQDSGTAEYIAIPLFSTTASCRFRYANAAGTPTSSAEITSTAPFTWASNDKMIANLTYEAA